MNQLKQQHMLPISASILQEQTTPLFSSLAVDHELGPSPIRIGPRLIERFIRLKLKMLYVTLKNSITYKPAFSLQVCQTKENVNIKNKNKKIIA